MLIGIKEGGGGRSFQGLAILMMDLVSENFDLKDSENFNLKIQRFFKLKGFHSIVRLASSPRDKTRATTNAHL